MKKLFAIIMLLLLTACANYGANTQPNMAKDRLCLGVGSMASAASQKLAAGRTVDDLLYQHYLYSTREAKKYSTVIQYVHAGNLNSEEAMKQMYLKCLQGEWD